MRHELGIIRVDRQYPPLSFLSLVANISSEFDKSFPELRGRLDNGIILVYTFLSRYSKCDSILPHSLPAPALPL